MSADPFSDVLRLTEAKSVMTGGFTAGGKWALHIPRPDVITIAAIAKGSCLLRLDGHKTAIRVDEGDVGLLSGDSGFVIGSDLTAPIHEVEATDKRGRIDQINRGGETTVLVGRVSLQPSSAALVMDVLPSRIHIKASSPRAASLRWLIEELLAEATSPVPGTGVASEKLAELLFVQILRAHVASTKTLPASWMRATTDERISRALKLVHETPGRSWSVDQLAKAAAMSRTRFAVRFKAVAGTAPLEYLTEWRMHLARQRLREADSSIGELASELGYASESAFSNAFKRIVGKAPRMYRASVRAVP
ncbi:MAG: AraC family transcriptional regulator [Kofleriaceae bacterium]